MTSRILMLVLATLLSTTGEELLDQIVDHHHKKAVHVSSHRRTS